MSRPFAWWIAALAAVAVAFLNVPAAWAVANPDSIAPTSTMTSAGITCKQSSGPSNGICRTDNATVTYYLDSSGKFELESPDRVVVFDVMGRFAQTDLTTNYDSTPVFSGSGETDVIYQEGSDGLSSGAVGVTWCNDKQDGTTWLCDQQYIRIRGNGNYTGESAGHETGHAVGLVHGRESAPKKDMCASVMGIMRGPLDCFNSVSLGSNIIQNINDVY